MKKLIFLLLLFNQLFAQPGINIIVLKGTIAGFKPANNTRYVPDGFVHITSSIQGGNIHDVSFDGSGPNGKDFFFHYDGTGDFYTPGPGNNININLKGFDFGRIANSIFQGSGNIITYNGTPQSALYYNIKAEHFIAGGKVKLFAGTWEDPKTFHNVVIGYTFADWYYTNDSTGNNTKLFGNSLYLGVVDQGDIRGKVLLDAEGKKDNGVFDIRSGNIVLTNIDAQEGYGYLLRLIQLELGYQLRDQTSYIFDCISANTLCYGLADVRTEKTQWLAGVIPLNGGNIQVSNNTASGKRDINSGYVTNLLVWGDMNGYRITFNNNSADSCRNAPDGSAQGQCLIKNNCNTGCFLDSNNNYSSKPGQGYPVGYLDKSYQVVIGGPLYQKKAGAFPDYIPLPPDILVCPPARIDTVYQCPPIQQLYSIFSTQTLPISVGTDSKPIELGIKFKSTLPIMFIKGIRFYKNVGNSGQHIGKLYDSTGKLLASAIFTSETSSGWQTVLFQSSVQIKSNTTYIATYYSDSGFYSQTLNALGTNIINGPLIGLADGISGPNGIYGYGSIFPNENYQKSNYWVDVVGSNLK